MPRPPKIKPANPKPVLTASERRAATKTEFARLYGISYVSVWRACKAGRLRTVRIGKRELVLLDSV